MSKPKYTCPQCGRTSGLPDACCGRAMLQKGSFVCRTCGASAGIAGQCCGEPMQQV